jgi:hypothetical protein
VPGHQNRQRLGYSRAAPRLGRDLPLQAAPAADPSHDQRGRRGLVRSIGLRDPAHRGRRRGPPQGRGWWAEPCGGACRRRYVIAGHGLFLERYSRRARRGRDPSRSASSLTETTRASPTAHVRAAVRLDAPAQFRPRLSAATVREMLHDVVVGLCLGGFARTLGSSHAGKPQAHRPACRS